MGETICWSPALLYRERSGPPGIVQFRYPARLESVGYLLGACLCFLFCTMIAVSITDPGWERATGLVLAACFFLPFGAVAAHRLWTIRILEVDPVRRDLALLLQTPVGRRRES